MADSPSSSSISSSWSSESLSMTRFARLAAEDTAAGMLCCVDVCCCQQRSLASSLDAWFWQCPVEVASAPLCGEPWASWETGECRCAAAAAATLGHCFFRRYGGPPGAVRGWLVGYCVISAVLLASSSSSLCLPPFPLPPTTTTTPKRNSRPPWTCPSSTPPSRPPSPRPSRASRLVPRPPMEFHRLLRARLRPHVACGLRARHASVPLRSSVHAVQGEASPGSCTRRSDVQGAKVPAGRHDLADGAAALDHRSPHPAETRADRTRCRTS